MEPLADEAAFDYFCFLPILISSTSFNINFCTLGCLAPSSVFVPKRRTSSVTSATTSEKTY